MTSVKRLQPVIGVDNQNYFPAGPSVGSIEINGNPAYAALSISTSHGTNAMQRMPRMNPRYYSKREISRLDPLFFMNGPVIARELRNAYPARSKNGKIIYFS